jgi:hypothetical protein
VRAADSKSDVSLPEQTSTVSEQTSALPEQTSALSEQATALDDVRDRAEMERHITQIAQWQSELEQDEDVLTYQASEAQSWRLRAQQFLEDFESGKTVAGEDAVRDLIHDATRIHDQAGEVKGKFATRNELIRDVVSSLEEIGFFVADPYFESADTPCGPVIVRAVRGSESMTASIDLSDTIKSVWDGIPDETCKDAFFGYLEKMGQKGVTIEPFRADLQIPPILLRKGAKDLPADVRSSQEHHA